MKKNNIISLTVLTLLIFASCKKEFVNPNGATDVEILTSKEGLISLSVGMKSAYATSLGGLFLNTGITSRELKGITTGISTSQLEEGASVLANDNGSIKAIWQNMYKVMGMADNLIEKAPSVLSSDANLRAGIVAHAHIFKALSLGNLAIAFEKFPQQTNQTGDATYVSRETALQTAIDLLAQAKALLTSTAPSTEFNNKVLGNPTGVDFSMVNIINALTARYSLWLKKYNDAYAAANLVDLNVKSQFVFTTNAQNPLNTGAVLTVAMKPRVSFGLIPALVDIADGRFNFYSSGAATVVGGESIKNFSGFGTSITAPIPVYLPDEMRLIKAESVLLATSPISGTTNPASVLSELNAVRTQTTGDVFAVYANLPVYAGLTTVAALTDEIYKQRCMELFCTGNKLEDSRRLGRAASSTNLVERNRNFYPYPIQERQNNPNTPADPSF